MIVAIDGPAGAGKSTVARAVAKRIGAGYLDTGAMYRALTWLALQRGTDLDDAEELAALANCYPSRLSPVEDGVSVQIADTDVTAAIRAPEVTAEVSRVSAHPPVRAAIVAAQQDVIATGDWVADGRDVGTVVAPDADVKVFMTANVDERARRRRRDLERAGQQVAQDEMVREIDRRDGIDSARDASPLEVADGALLLDTSEMTEQQVVEAVQTLVEGARG
ncbi:MAG: (d)CMP kinase [Thermoleophilia bacterium]|nr:(d)CMP kinase [Thermoleophilia bacterium]